MNHRKESEFPALDKRPHGVLPSNHDLVAGDRQLSGYFVDSAEGPVMPFDGEVIRRRMREAAERLGRTALQE